MIRKFIQSFEIRKVSHKLRNLKGIDHEIEEMVI